GQVHRRRKLWRFLRAQTRAQAGAGARGRRARPGDDLAGDRFWDVRPAPPCADGGGRAPCVDGGGGGRRGGAGQPPAAARDARGQFNREALREVERYAAGDYLLDLLKGERDAAAVARISARVAAFTGLDPALVQRLAGRIDTGTFQRELHRDKGRIGSAYDP